MSFIIRLKAALTLPTRREVAVELVELIEREVADDLEVLVREIRSLPDGPWDKGAAQ